MSKSNLYLGDCLSNPAILVGFVVILNEVKDWYCKRFFGLRPQK